MAHVDSIQAEISKDGYFDDLYEHELNAQLELQQALSYQEESAYSWR